MRAFWDIAPCSLVGVTDVSEVRTASIPEGSDLHTRGRENLKSHSIKKGSSARGWLSRTTTVIVIMIMMSGKGSD
jgi:hypothetical protein